MIWMDLWPEEGYSDVGLRELESIQINGKAHIIEQACRIHQSMVKITSGSPELSMPLTPVAFTNFLRAFKKLYQGRHNSLGDLRRKYLSGLNQMKTAENRIADAQKQLDAKEPKIKLEKLVIKDVMEDLNKLSATVHEDMEVLRKEEAELGAHKAEAEVIREECDRVLKSAGPAVEEAIDALK
jgi:hypothetical protein